MGFETEQAPRNWLYLSPVFPIFCLFQLELIKLACRQPGGPQATFRLRIPRDADSPFYTDFFPYSNLCTHLTLTGCVPLDIHFLGLPRHQLLTGLHTPSLCTSPARSCSVYLFHTTPEYVRAWGTVPATREEAHLRKVGVLSPLTRDDITLHVTCDKGRNRGQSPAICSWSGHGHRTAEKIGL